VCGLKNKLFDTDFTSFCQKYDIFAFLEVWNNCCHDDIVSTFPGYVVYTKFRDYNERGGVAVCIKYAFIAGIKKVYLEFSDCIFLLIDKAFTGASQDILIGFVYIHPMNSSIKTDTRIQKGIDFLESCLISISSDIQLEDVTLIVMGDLNARTGDMQDIIVGDDSRYIYHH